MRNPLSISNFKNRDPLAAIVLFVVAVVALETAFAWMPEIRWKGAFGGNHYQLPPRGPDLQIMGDSVAQGGILATQLAQALPDQPYVFNGALSGSGPEFPYFILQREIAQGKKPKAILYAPSPHTFASQRVPLLVGGFCSWAEIGQIACQRIEPCEVLYGAFCKLSYTLRYREQLGEILKGRKPEVAPPETAAASPTPTPPRHYPVEKILPMYKNPFQVSRFNQVFFDKFLALAQQENVPVYWVTMPILPAVEESRKKIGFQQTYYSFLDALPQSYGVKLVHKEFLVYRDELFKDYSHLNGDGAQEFTRFLGEKLAAAPLPLRQSALPAKPAM